LSGFKQAVDSAVSLIFGLGVVFLPLGSEFSSDVTDLGPPEDFPRGLGSPDKLPIAAKSAANPEHCPGVKFVDFCQVFNNY
jgi:hypothetical protein